MRFAGYPDDTPEIDVCAGVERPTTFAPVMTASGQTR
jgi:hypothetical protein